MIQFHLCQGESLKRYGALITIFSIVILLFYTTFSFASTSSVEINAGKIIPDPGWPKYWGGDNFDSSWAVATDSDGNTYVAGYTSSFGNGMNDAIILKYDKYGGIVPPERTWGGIKDDYAYAIALDNNYVYVTGRTASYGNGASNLFLLKYDKSLNPIWNTTWGGTSDDYSKAIAVYNNEPVIAGLTYSYSLNPPDILIVKFDYTGKEIWNKTWGDTGYDEGHAIAIDSTGIIYVAGTTSKPGGGDKDVVVLKYDNNGVNLWPMKWGDTGDDWGYGVALGDDNEIFVTGLSMIFGTSNGKEFLFKIQNNTTLDWCKLWGGEKSIDTAWDCAVDSDYVYVVGETKSYGNGKSDISLLKYNKSGDHILNKTWGTTEIEQGLGITICGGSIYIVGGADNPPHSRDAIILKSSLNGGPPVPEHSIIIILIVLILIIFIILSRNKKRDK